MAHSPRAGSVRDDSYQHYLFLSQQQETLRHHLSLQIPSTSPMTAVSPDSYSWTPSSSRSTYAHSLADEPASPPSLHRAYSSPVSAHPLPAMPGVEHQHQHRHRSFSDDVHDDKLYEVNQQIKATLTQLLNHDSVRHDDKFRAYIQSRLMDAELELRRQRRRRSSVDREIAASIAEHFGHASFRHSP